MKNEEMIVLSAQILKQRNFALIFALVLLCANFLLAASLLAAKKEIVLVPNSLDKESSIINGRMSPAYLEALTRDVVNLMLNTTPANIEYNSKAILKIAHPAFYGQLKKDLNERSKDVIRRRISMFFSPQTMAVNSDYDGAVITGKLSTYLGKEEVLTEDKIYSIKYAFVGFRPLIVDFHEVATKGGEDEN